jgi:hypothetical protein
LAGVGGNVRFLRETADLRRYFEVVYDIVGVVHLQAGNINGWGNQAADGGQIGTNGVRMLDNFQMGPNLVHGFAPAGIGPRDLTFGTTNDALGGTHYWGASLGISDAAFLHTQGNGDQGRGLRGRRLVVELCGTDGLSLDGRDDGAVVRQHVHQFRRRRRLDLGVTLWTAPVRSRLSDHETLLRQDAVFPVRRRREFLTAAAGRAGTKVA